MTRREYIKQGRRIISCDGPIKWHYLDMLLLNYYLTWRGCRKVEYGTNMPKVSDNYFALLEWVDHFLDPESMLPRSARLTD